DGDERDRKPRTADAAAPGEPIGDAEWRDLCAIPSTRSEEHTSELQSHRDLHSSPPRRSSDLMAMSAIANRGRLMQPLLVSRLETPNGETFAQYHPRDRKSTRLNSSPTEIYTLPLHDALPI